MPIGAGPSLAPGVPCRWICGPCGGDSELRAAVTRTSQRRGRRRLRVPGRTDPSRLTRQVKESAGGGGTCERAGGGANGAEAAPEAPDAAPELEKRGVAATMAARARPGPGCGGVASLLCQAYMSA